MLVRLRLRKSKFMGWLQLTLALIQLAPEILKLIMQVEQIIGGGNGAVKKELVMQSVILGGAAELEPKVSAMVDNTVTKLNSINALAKK